MYIYVENEKKNTYYIDKEEAISKVNITVCFGNNCNFLCVYISEWKINLILTGNKLNQLKIIVNL